MQSVEFRVLADKITDKCHPFRKWMRFLIFLILQKVNLIGFWGNIKYINTVSINFRLDDLQKRKDGWQEDTGPVTTARWPDTQNSWRWGSQTFAPLDRGNIKISVFPLFWVPFQRHPELLISYLAIPPD